MSSVLSDQRIKWHQEYDKNFDITPFDESCVQPASYDLHLGDKFTFIKEDQTIDLHDDDIETTSFNEHDGTIVLLPNECVLGTTVETIRMPREFVGVVDGRSSLGRLFVSVHVSAGFVDCGFEGEITLELVNHGRNPVKLHAGDRIAQIRYMKVMGKVENDYSETGHYQNQKGPKSTEFNFK